MYMSESSKLIAESAESLKTVDGVSYSLVWYEYVLWNCVKVALHNEVFPGACYGVVSFCYIRINPQLSLSRYGLVFASVIPPVRVGVPNTIASLTLEKLKEVLNPALIHIWLFIYDQTVNAGLPSTPLD